MLLEKYCSSTVKNYEQEKLVSLVAPMTMKHHWMTVMYIYIHTVPVSSDGAKQGRDNKTRGRTFSTIDLSLLPSSQT